MSELIDLLPDYALGTLSAAEADRIDAALVESPELRAALAAIEDAYFGLAASLTPVPPAPAVKSRLLASVAADRYGPFVKDVARYCGLALERAQAVLAVIGQPDKWEIGLVPGNFLFHFEGGPGAYAADCGLVILPAHFQFPRHKHLGPEVNYILEGSMIDDDGRSYGPGDALVKTVDDEHSFTIGPNGCTFLAVQSGFEIAEGWVPPSS